MNDFYGGLFHPPNGKIQLLSTYKNSDYIFMALKYILISLKHTKKKSRLDSVVLTEKQVVSAKRLRVK